LRSVNNTALSFDEYPYCLKKDRKAIRPTIPVALEDYLAKQSGVVSMKQLKDFAAKVLGIEKTQLDSYVGKIPNILRAGRSLLIHFKALSFGKSRLAPIVDYLARFKGSPITARSLYLQNLSVCQDLGIATPMLLAHLIQHFYPGGFTFSSISNGTLASLRPRLPRRDKAAVRSGKPASARSFQAKKLSVTVEILAHLKDQAQPCSTRELYDIVQGKVSTLEYLYQNLRDKKTILRYTGEAWVARQALGWTGEKQAAIEQMAADHLEKSGAVFGLCSEIYRERQSQLPEIAQHIPWTPVLFQGLLGSQNRYLALGWLRNIYVSASNQHGIASLNDLLLYLLQTDYGGSASRSSFISHLCSIGIIKKKLPIFVSGKDKRVVIDGDVIRIADREVNLPS
jgi:hypothetical protein